MSKNGLMTLPPNEKFAREDFFYAKCEKLRARVAELERERDSARDLADERGSAYSAELAAHGRTIKMKNERIAELERTEATTTATLHEATALLEAERKRTRELQSALQAECEAHRVTGESLAMARLDGDAAADVLEQRVAELHAALDLADCTQREGGDVRRCGEARCWRCRAEAAEGRVAELERENTALRGITPELPPRSLHGEGDGMPRYGLRFNGPTEPFSVPMADGYWTPWHLAETLRDAAEQRVRELEARLQFDPGGSDKIDELDQAIQFLRHELDVTRTELGLKRSDCVRLGMDCDALKGEKKAAEQRAKRLEVQHKKLGRLIHSLLDWANNLDCECDQYDDGSTCSACRIVPTLRQTLREHVAAEKSAAIASGAKETK